MKLIVTGSRDWGNRAGQVDEVRKVLDQYESFERRVLVHGGARGLDKVAGQLATALGWATIEERADWTLGKNAGHVRNQRMVDMHGADAEMVAAFPGIDSRGTYDMAARAWAAGIPVWISLFDVRPTEALGGLLAFATRHGTLAKFTDCYVDLRTGLLTRKP